ncbi:MAG TPA: anhydro-N-acetylmuramic acid kinase [Acidobacteriaceae bacterium]|nr:anhydro-N-acetylmuramic acid kinase [Acidobacteriaceae bacterium]
MAALTVAGIMSGTSADGVDVALVRITPARNSDFPRLRLLAHMALPFPPAVRQRVLQVMNAPAESVAGLSRLHWRLGQLYASSLERALAAHPVRLDLVGCHGQTIYHQGTAQSYLGASVACTWQLGEASVLAAKFGVPVVSDFRPADLAIGGQGAPLVPFLDYAAFHNPKRNRVLQNLGGIGNLTVVPAGATPEKVFAFDTGPGNMVIDAVMSTHFGKRYDARGKVASRGHVLARVLAKNLLLPFFHTHPPKSAGREEFGREFVTAFLDECRREGGRAEDAVATATALTASSIGMAWTSFVKPALAEAPTDFIIAGGGAKNETLLRTIEAEISATSKIYMKTSDDYGIPSAAKEAMAFALLAYQTWNGLPGNLPSATGAKRAAVLGKITYA